MSGVVVLRSTGPMNNPSHFTPEFCKKLKGEDPLAYTTSVLAQFGQTESSFVDPDDVDAAAEPRHPDALAGSCILSCDPSHLLGRDGWAAVVCCWMFPPGERREVMLTHPGLEGVYLGPARGSMGQPLYEYFDARPFLSVLCAEIMPADATFDDVCKHLRGLVTQYHPHLAASDYGADAGGLTSLFNSLGVMFRAFPWSSPQRATGHQILGRLIADRQVYIPQVELREQLKRVRAVLQPGGTVTYKAPRSKAGGHCDLAAALVTHCIAESEQLVPGSPIAPFLSGRYVTSGR